MVKSTLTVNKSGIRISRKKRREEFLPEDKEWLETHPDIQFDRADLVNAGTEGTVFVVKGNKNLIIKVPKGVIPDLSLESHLAREDFRISREDIATEADFCMKNRTNDEKLFTPSKVIKLGIRTSSGKEQYGIVRPMLRVSDNTLKNLTVAQLEDLRHKVIDISEKGFKIMDGLQIGVDRQGRIQLFDMGFVIRKSKLNSFARELIFAHNNDEWKAFLKRTGKKNLMDYGAIRPRKVKGG